MDERGNDQLQQDAGNIYRDTLSDDETFEEQEHRNEQAPPRGSIAPPPSAQVVSERLGDTRMSVYQFGPRFVPHSESPIKSILPLPEDRFILMGDMNGLGVLEVFPGTSSLSVEDNSTMHALEVATRRDLWVGESILQMVLLESSQDTDGNVQGVLLVLVGTGEPKPVRSVRMYNLASIMSLIKWTSLHPDAEPLVIQGPKGWSDQQTSSRRPHTPNTRPSAKNFKAMPISPQTHSAAEGFEPTSRSGHPSISTISIALSSESATTLVSPPEHSWLPQKLQDSVNPIDSTEPWDMVDDLPLRWATDYVNLASPGSRLAKAQVLFFELWRVKPQGTLMLAVATKTVILLYETPKGERAFKFVKEFRTPLPAKSIRFVQQTPPDPSKTGFLYQSQLSLFVVFEKRACLIRISDVAISEMELFDDGGDPPPPIGTSCPQSGVPTSSLAGSGFRKSINAFGLLREGKGSWLPLCMLDVPYPCSASRESLSFSNSKTILFMSRGRRTHIVPSPLPNPLSSYPPLRIIRWHSDPRQVIARLSSGPTKEPKLQVIAFTEQGVEVVETGINFLLEPPDFGPAIGKGKGKPQSISTSEPLVRAIWESPYVAGYLARGGSWNTLNTSPGHPEPRQLSASGVVVPDWSKTGTEAVKGIYAWAQRGNEDYRIVWLGDASPEEQM